MLAVCQLANLCGSDCSRFKWARFTEWEMEVCRSYVTLPMVLGGVGRLQLGLELWVSGQCLSSSLCSCDALNALCLLCYRKLYKMSVKMGLTSGCALEACCGLPDSLLHVCQRSLPGSSTCGGMWGHTSRGKTGSLSALWLCASGGF